MREWGWLTVVRGHEMIDTKIIPMIMAPRYIEFRSQWLTTQDDEGQCHPDPKVLVGVSLQYLPLQQQ